MVSQYRVARYRRLCRSSENVRLRGEDEGRFARGCGPLQDERHLSWTSTGSPTRRLRIFSRESVCLLYISLHAAHQLHQSLPISSSGCSLARSNCALINVAYSIVVLTWSRHPSTVIEIMQIAIELLPPRSL